MRLVKVRSKYNDTEQWINPEQVISVIYIKDLKEYSLVFSDPSFECDLKETEFYTLLTKAGIEFEPRQEEGTGEAEVSGDSGVGVYTPST